MSERPAGLLLDDIRESIARIAAGREGTTVAMKATVYLVGAGPGNGGLLTKRCNLIDFSSDKSVSPQAVELRPRGVGNGGRDPIGVGDPRRVNCAPPVRERTEAFQHAGCAIVGPRQCKLSFPTQALAVGHRQRRE